MSVIIHLHSQGMSVIIHLHSQGMSVILVFTLTVYTHSGECKFFFTLMYNECKNLHHISGITLSVILGVCLLCRSQVERVGLHLVRL